MRSSGRSNNELRPVSIETDISRYAEGSCLISFGHTQVRCTASLEERVPQFLRNSGKGWVTAEYSMLPRATHNRTRREVSEGKQSGRTMEIQRLIARSLRTAVDLEQLGERQITVDCDVLQADGGTRTAAITGGYVALHIALDAMVEQGILRRSPLLGQLAAVSCGIVRGTPVLDLDYQEDSNADVDANFVINQSHQIIEMQGTAEKTPFSRAEMLAMLDLALEGSKRLFAVQQAAIAAHYA